MAMDPLLPPWVLLRRAMSRRFAWAIWQWLAPTKSTGSQPSILRSSRRTENFVAPALHFCRFCSKGGLCQLCVWLCQETFPEFYKWCCDNNEPNKIDSCLSHTSLSTSPHLITKIQLVILPHDHLHYHTPKPITSQLFKYLTEVYLNSYRWILLSLRWTWPTVWLLDVGFTVPIRRSAKFSPNIWVPCWRETSRNV